jgi:hypothetical protein
MALHIIFVVSWFPFNNLLDVLAQIIVLILLVTDKFCGRFWVNFVETKF